MLLVVVELLLKDGVFVVHKDILVEDARYVRVYLVDIFLDLMGTQTVSFLRVVLPIPSALGTFCAFLVHLLDLPEYLPYLVGCFATKHVRTALVVHRRAASIGIYVFGLLQLSFSLFLKLFLPELSFQIVDYVLVFAYLLHFVFLLPDLQTEGSLQLSYMTHCLLELLLFVFEYCLELAILDLQLSDDVIVLTLL